MDLYFQLRVVLCGQLVVPVTILKCLKNSYIRSFRRDAVDSLPLQDSEQVRGLYAGFPVLYLVTTLNWRRYVEPGWLYPIYAGSHAPSTSMPSSGF
jgi:hypothetical protein